MRNLFKIFLLSLCVLALSSTVIYANNGSDSLKAGEVNRIQPASISDLTYAVLVWTGSDLFPSYYPQLEFEAGNSLRATNVSSNFIEVTGIWTEVEFGDIFSYFTAQVETEDTTTTTISIPPTERDNQTAIPVQPLGTKMIDLWGISFNFSFEIPPPFDFISLGVSMLIGSGTYLGKNAVFAGFTGIVDPEEAPEFKSITPDSGLQEESLSVTIGGSNTTFQDDGPVEIAFIPNNNNELSISGISTISNTEIEFNLDIAVNAEVGFKSVTVTYDGGNKSVTGNKVFEVKSKP